MTIDVTARERRELAPATTSRIDRPLLLTLALLAAVAPLATDLYLPAFPKMAMDLGTDETGAQLTLTVFLVGMALGQLVFGPLSDRLGRRGPLLLGVVLCIAAGVVSVAATSLGVLVAARLVQGLAGSAGMVIGRAVISDLSSGKAAARAMSLMMIVGGVAPVVGPALGGVVVGPIGWRGLLGVVLTLTVVMLVSVLAFVPESFPAEQRARERAGQSSPTNAWRGLLTREFLGYTVAFAFGFGVLMSYISASPFLYQVQMGLSETAYGVVFGLNALGLMVSGALSARLVATRSARALAGTGLITMLLASALLMLLVLADAPPGWFAAPIAVAVASVGLVMGNGTALALEAVSQGRGFASAVLGAAQFGLGGVVSALVGLGDGALPLALAMTGCAAVAISGFAAAAPARRRRQHRPV